MVLSVFIGGFVFLKLYGWFIITTFNAPVISLPQALGLMLFIGYLKPKPKKDEDEKFSIEKYAKQFIELIVIASFALGIGYLILQFV